MPHSHRGLQLLNPLFDGVAAFSPSDVAGFLLWLNAALDTWQDAAMTIRAIFDEDVVGGWTDQSGNGNHATQATTANKSLLKLSIVHARPVIRFDGTDDWLNLVNSIFTLGNATSFLVAKSTPAATNQMSLSAKDPNRWYSPAFQTNNASKCYVGAKVIDTPDLGSGFNVITLRHDNPDIEAWLNGVSVGTDSDNNINALTGLNIGSYDEGTSGFLKGDIAELLIYTALSDADRQSIENYLNGRYRIW